MHDYAFAPSERRLASAKRLLLRLAVMTFASPACGGPEQAASSGMRKVPKTRVRRVANVIVDIPDTWTCKGARCAPPASFGRGKCILGKSDSDRPPTRLFGDMLKVLSKAKLRASPLKRVTNDKIIRLNSTLSLPRFKVAYDVLGRELRSGSTRLSALCVGHPRTDLEFCESAIDSIGFGAAEVGKGKVYTRAAWAIRLPGKVTFQQRGKRPGDDDLLRVRGLTDAGSHMLVVARATTVARLLRTISRGVNITASNLVPLEGRPDLRHALLRINRPAKVGVVSLAKLGRQVISIVCLLTASDLSAALKLQQAISASMRFAAP